MAEGGGLQDDELYLPRSECGGQAKGEKEADMMGFRGSWWNDVCDVCGSCAALALRGCAHVMY